MSERTGFEKVTLLFIVVGAAVVLFGTGAVIGGNIATERLQKAATQNCGAEFDKLTGEFMWTACPPPAPEPEVVYPEPDPEPAIPAAPTVETPSEPVH